jgi:hypothetical protein
MLSDLLDFLESLESDKLEDLELKLEMLKSLLQACCCLLLLASVFRQC